MSTERYEQTFFLVLTQKERAEIVTDCMVLNEQVLQQHSQDAVAAMQSNGLWSADGDIYRRRYFNCVDPDFISALNRVVYSQSVLLHDACLEQARVVKAGKLRCVMFALNCFCPQLFAV